MLLEHNVNIIIKAHNSEFQGQEEVHVACMPVFWPMQPLQWVTGIYMDGSSKVWNAVTQPP